MENEINCSIFWENSMDHQTDPFQSALSSMVSSPTASNNGNLDNSIVVRELIGRLNCDSEFNNTSSCYNTPLNSPPKLNLSIMENRDFSSLSPFSTDPGFAHRAATFSPFAAKYDVNNKLSRCSTPESSVSEQIPIGGLIGHSSRKRKSNPKGKGKEHAAPASVKKHPNNITSENSESSAKRSKSEDENDANDNNNNNNSKALESQKDYIHVRARRGQATDAHSLAERVRREKIGERMKVLQDLVPGCNKVTGKAVMLDEIINYVQSLQRQVEFLSMKLATVDPRMDVNTEVLVSNSKDMFHNIYPSDSFAFGGNQMMQLPHIDNFSETASQVSTVWEDDLHSVVQMGFGQNQTHNFREIYPSAEMKVEL